MPPSQSDRMASSSPLPAPQPPRLRLGVTQTATLPTLSASLAALAQTAARAAEQAVDVLLFPEAYLGGYPRGATFGTAVGARDDAGREQFLQYWRQSVDLGDATAGAAGASLSRGVAAREGAVARQAGEAGKKAGNGDGTREELERVARESGVFLVVGLVERAGGTLYCSVVYVCPRFGVIGKRRKVMPTGSERLIWGQGQPSSLRAVTTTIRGVHLTLAAAICWENYMPLLRYSLYSQNVNLYLAPTADGRDAWLSLMRTVACEGRCFVLSANQCVRRESLPEWIHGGKREEEMPLRGNAKKASAITEGGNEIVLPQSKEKENSVSSSNGAPREGTKPLGRKMSISIENGHEIVLPLRKTKSNLSDGVLPEEGPSRSHKRKRSIAIGNGHEIVLPLPAGKSDPGNTHTAASTAPGRKKPEPKSREGSPSASEFVSRGGSCIVSPFGEVLAGPLWENDSDLLIADVDFDDCLRGRLDFDVAGSYSRNDSFKLSVEGLDLSPPA